MTLDGRFIRGRGGGVVAEFSGFQDSDFDAYQQRKWVSNLFNRERLEVKQKLLALGQKIAPALREAGPLVEAEASVEHPALWNGKRVEAQHLYFVRTAEDRRALELELGRARGLAAQLTGTSPLRNHVLLTITIDVERVEVALRLHADARVDRENLERKLQEPWERLKFLELVHALGPSYSVSVLGGGISPLPASELADSQIGELLQELVRGGQFLCIGMTFGRTDPRVREPGFADTLREAVLRLVPLYQFVAWTRTNDRTARIETLREERQARKQRGLAKNDRVRIVSGVFAGKAGVVQDIDAKGQLKVLVGKLAVKVDAADVAKA